MAKKSIIVRGEKRTINVMLSLTSKKKPEHAIRIHNRCKLCGRGRAFMRKFDMCRICFRELAGQGLIMGVKKSSW